ncbi:adp-ribosylation factor f-related [Anaeramoeba ignava]|uniref:Adp-ribosylation factor f-related n=1 Tax=Anaeramoeba ignava TaxID=1746090 RepID=A0A9Q0L8F3_ANAIG|nr:adp-ribosylation factor f-related [Anaeramoeba ignava]
MTNLFVSGSNQTYQLAIKENPSLIVRDPISLKETLMPFIREEQIQFISSGSTHTVLSTSTGKIILWGISTQTQKSFIIEKEKKNQTNQNGKIDSLPKKQQQKILKERRKLFVVISDFSGRIISQISSGAFSFIILINGEVFLVDLSLPVWIKKKIQTQKIDFSSATKWKISKICCGSNFFVAIDEENHLVTWGNNSYGQLAHGDLNDREKPELVHTKIENIETISAGGHHLFIITKNNEIYCCGKNTHGQLGLNDKIHRKELTQPYFPPFIGKIREISCGDEHTIIISEYQKIYVCGKGSAVGVTSTDDQLVFVECCLPPDLDFVNIAAGGGYGQSFIMMSTSQGEVFSAGGNKYGQLGINTNKEVQLVPARVHLSEDEFAIGISCGWLHSCILTRKKGSLNFNFGDDIQKLKSEEMDFDQSSGNFSEIPFEVMAIIFSFLSKKDLCKVACSSKEMNYMASHDWVWAPIYEQDHLRKPSLKEMKIIQKGFPVQFNENDNVDPKLKKKKNKKKMKKKKLIKTIIFGLDASGKTSILYRLALPDSVLTTIPTVGFNVETVTISNQKFEIWDIGGGSMIYYIWNHYLPGADAIIFVIDSTDQFRFDEVKTKLLGLLSHEESKNLPVLIFANKQELPTACKPKEIVEKLSLRTLTSHHWIVKPCSAIKGEGIKEGFEWIKKSIEK